MDIKSSLPIILRPQIQEPALTFAQMIIAVDTREHTGIGSSSNWLVGCVDQLANLHPEHQFIVLSDKDALTTNHQYSENVSIRLLKQPSPGVVFWKIWYDYQLPALLKKIKADLLIATAGMASLRTKIPQVMLVNDLSFLQFPAFYSKKYLRFVQARFPACLEKSRSVLVFSELAKLTLNEQYRVDEKKIKVLPAGSSSNLMLSNQSQTEQIKEKYSAGTEYFLYRGAIHLRSNLVNLLKAFSIFKKKQKSNMRLLIASAESVTDTAFSERLRLYKYRDEVHLMTDVNSQELEDITAAAYACVNLSPLHSDIANLIIALEVGVPVMAGNFHLAIEILGEAAVFANPEVPENIAEKLILLYKDEGKRAALVQAGIQQAARYPPSGAVNQLWENIMETIQSSGKL